MRQERQKHVTAIEKYRGGQRASGWHPNFIASFPGSSLSHAGLGRGSLPGHVLSSFSEASQQKEFRPALLAASFLGFGETCTNILEEIKLRRESHPDTSGTSGDSRVGARATSGFQALGANTVPEFSKDTVFRHVPCRVLNHSRKLPLGLSENGGFKNTNVWWTPPPGRAVSVPSPETGQQRNILELGAGNSEDERTKQT